LNINRNGVSTGEYLYYSATPWRKANPEAVYNQFTNPSPANSAFDRDRAIYLGWNLVTKTSTRSVQVLVDGDTIRNLNQTRLFNDDILGDASVAPFAGPAIDAESLLFEMRRLPLAVGYKTTLQTRPFLLGHGAPRPVDLAVTAVEPVQTVAGKFSCYKVVFAGLGQTFWFGVEGAHLLVKFQSGDVQAELVKTWGPTAFEDALSFFKAAGWHVERLAYSLQEGTGDASAPSAPGDVPNPNPDVHMRLWRIYTPPAEVEQAVQRACDDLVKKAPNEFVIRSNSMQKRVVGGHPSLSCIVDTVADGKVQSTTFYTFVGTDSLILQFQRYNLQDLGVFRWRFEQILDTIKLP
jgi:hypothetical protein